MSTESATRKSWYEMFVPRDFLGWTVVATSAVGIVFLSYVMIKLPAGSDAARTSQVFNSVLPLLGTWVGTVLAFYFTRENFQAASETVNKAIDRLTTDQKLQQTPVKTVMIPRARLKGIELSNTITEQTLTAKQIIDYVNQNKVSRVPVFRTDNSMLYIIDDRTVFQVAAEATPKKPEDITLADFLKLTIQGKTVKDIVGNFAVVALSANLAQARDALVAKAGAHEVIVTPNGGASEPVQGWLTESDIARTGQIE